MKKNFWKAFVVLWPMLLIVGTLVAGPIITNFTTDILQFGHGAVGTQKLIFNSGAGSGNAALEFNTGALQFANDGVTFQPLSAGIPAGAMVEWGTQVAPTGWLITDGTAYSRSTYSALFSAIGTAFGIGDGSTTFNVPNFQGVTSRMVDNGFGQDPDTLARTALAGSTFGGTFTVTVSTFGGSPTLDVSVADWNNIAVGMQITDSASEFPADSIIIAKTLPCVTTPCQVTINNNAGSGVGGDSSTVTNGAVGDYVGSFQQDAFQQHTHTYNIVGPAGGDNFHASGGFTQGTTFPSTGGATGRTSSETRGKNLYVNKIIKF